jgi:hypothetical protein
VKPAHVARVLAVLGWMAGMALILDGQPPAVVGATLLSSIAAALAVLWQGERFAAWLRRWAKARVAGCRARLRHKKTEGALERA